MKVTTKEIEIIMARWHAYAWSIGCEDGDKEYIIAEQCFVFGAISQLLDIGLGEIMMNDLPPAAGMCLMSGRPLCSVYPANPESVRLRGGW